MNKREITRKNAILKGMPDNHKYGIVSIKGTHYYGTGKDAKEAWVNSTQKLTAIFSQVGLELTKADMDLYILEEVI